jgi:hypothetical protein
VEILLDGKANLEELFAHLTATSFVKAAESEANIRSPDIGILIPCKIIVFWKAYPEKLMIHILLDFLCLSGVSYPHENTTSTSTKRDWGHSFYDSYQRKMQLP